MQSTRELYSYVNFLKSDNNNAGGYYQGINHEIGANTVKNNIVNYVLTLRGAPSKKATLTAIKIFWQYLHDKGYLPDNPFKDLTPEGIVL